MYKHWTHPHAWGKPVYIFILKGGCLSFILYIRFHLLCSPIASIHIQQSFVSFYLLLRFLYFVSMHTKLRLYTTLQPGYKWLLRDNEKVYSRSSIMMYGLCTGCKHRQCHRLSLFVVQWTNIVLYEALSINLTVFINRRCIRITNLRYIG